jgi:hypothetical protein
MRTLRDEPLPARLAAQPWNRRVAGVAAAGLLFGAAGLMFQSSVGWHDAAASAAATANGSGTPAKSDSVGGAATNPTNLAATTAKATSATTTSTKATPKTTNVTAAAKTKSTATRAARSIGAPTAAKTTTTTAGTGTAAARSAGAASRAPAPTTKVASSASGVVPAPSAPPAGARPSASGLQSPAPTAVAQDERVTYHYNALGRRDPFQPLIGGGFIGMDVGGNAPPDVGGIKVVGIVWGASDKFALVEDPRGNSLVLRRGDKVMDGFVEDLKRDALVVRLNVDGQTHLVTIPVMRKGEQSNGND